MFEANRPACRGRAVLLVLECLRYGYHSRYGVCSEVIACRRNARDVNCLVEIIGTWWGVCPERTGGRTGL